MFEDLSPLALAPIIFLFRIVDVSLGTVRTILVLRGHRVFAAVLGFIEILIWLTAAGQVFAHLDRWYLAVAYAGGFATGNVVGIWIESKLALGWELVRAISRDKNIRLANTLREHTYDVTELDGTAADGEPVEILLVVTRRRRMPALLKLIAETDKTAIWTVSAVKATMTPTTGLKTMGTNWLGSRKRK